MTLWIVGFVGLFVGLLIGTFPMRVEGRLQMYRRGLPPRPDKQEVE